MEGMMYGGMMYWGLMYRGDYDGVHEGNIGWVVVDH